MITITVNWSLRYEKPGREIPFHGIICPHSNPFSKSFQSLHGDAAAGIKSPSGKDPLHSVAFYGPQGILVVHFEVTAHLEKQQPPESRTKEAILGVKVGGSKRRAPSLHDLESFVFEHGLMGRVLVEHGLDEAMA